MLNKRGFGVLLHPTSLPGAGGIGSLGKDARRFVDLLAAMGASYWQVLPLTPPACRLSSPLPAAQGGRSPVGRWNWSITRACGWCMGFGGWCRGRFESIRYLEGTE